MDILTTKQNSSTTRTIYNILEKVESGGKTDSILNDYLTNSNYSTKDKAYISNIVYTIIRKKRSFDDFINHHIKHTKIADCQPPVRFALRIGTCMKYIGRPNHACVNEAVGTVNSKRLRGFVNGVMRTISRNHNDWVREKIDNTEHYSHPDWIVELTKEVFNDDAKAILKNNNSIPPLSFVAVDRQAYEELCDYYEDEIVSKYPKLNIVMVKGARDFEDSYLFKDGKFYVSNVSSQIIANICNVEKGKRVLDLCAAPGGKTFALSQQVKSYGLVVARDISKKRLEQLKENIIRLNHSSEAVEKKYFSNISVEHVDGRIMEQDHTGFDTILIDAPCSGLGVLKRRVDLRWNLSKEDVIDLVEIQKDLISTAISSLKPNGNLVFSVCSYTKEETIEIDSWIEKTYPQLKAQTIEIENSISCGRGVLIKPLGDYDGMFVVKYVNKID